MSEYTEHRNPHRGEKMSNYIEHRVKLLELGYDSMWSKLCKLENRLDEYYINDRVSTLEDIVENDGRKLDELAERVTEIHGMVIHDEPQVQQTTDEFVRVRHGKWEYDAETAGFKCTACGKRIYGMTLEIGSGDIKYCPNCGARMEDENE